MNGKFKGWRSFTVSVQDDLFDDVLAAALKSGKNRSEFTREALVLALGILEAREVDPSAVDFHMSKLAQIQWAHESGPRL